MKKTTKRRPKKSGKKPLAVRVPELGDDVGILLCESDEENGGHRGLTDGDYSIWLCGNSKGFKKLGQYFLGLAGLDTSKDSSFHHHFGELRSLSGTRIELTVRKNKAAHYDYTR